MLTSWYEKDSQKDSREGTGKKRHDREHARHYRDS